MKRRTALASIGTGLSVALAGCAGASPPEADEVELMEQKSLAGTQAIRRLYTKRTGLSILRTQTPEITVPDGPNVDLTHYGVIGVDNDVDKLKPATQPTKAEFLFQLDDEYGIKEGTYDVYAFHIPDGQREASHGDVIRVKIGDEYGSEKLSRYKVVSSRPLYK